MTGFATADGFVPVSRFSAENGYWLGNNDEYVSIGTKLSLTSTDVIFTPSGPGKTGIWDGIGWTEVDIPDMPESIIGSEIGNYIQSLIDSIQELQSQIQALQDSC